MLDRPPPGLVAEPALPVPLAPLVLGKPREEVASLMPRLFNLCRAAQGMAANLALNLPVSGDTAPLRQEILRDHVMRLAVVLPQRLGERPTALPRDWQAGGLGLRRALFGPTGRLPHRWPDFAAFLANGPGIARLWRQIDSLFAEGDAVGGRLPFVSHATAVDAMARVENSCAVRVAAHPVVRALEAKGRGPLWRVVARSYDLEAVLDGAALTAETSTPGVAHVHATRGLYSISAATQDGRVTRFDRVTPTQHLVAPGGVLDHALASLPADCGARAPLVIDILDPCTPVHIKEQAYA